MKHIPALEKEVLGEFEYLKAIKSPVFIDATMGAAGHSLAISGQLLEENKSDFKIIGIDKDTSALDLAEKKIGETNMCDKIILWHDDFKNFGLFWEKIRKGNSLRKETIDGVLIDLGVSSMQLDNKDRGFSFQDPGARLDMRMDQNQHLSAFEVINTYPSEELSKIFFEYGEEQYGRNIANNIAKARTAKKITTVGDLLEVIEKSIPRRYIDSDGKHYATRTFQAIRIEVNKELTGLDKAIKELVRWLAPGTKMAVITFHSLEDRIVKKVFRELATDCLCPAKLPACVCNHRAEVTILHKKPIIPGDEETKINPRARSAKLRVIEKI